MQFLLVMGMDPTLVERKEGGSSLIGLELESLTASQWKSSSAPANSVLDLRHGLISFLHLRPCKQKLVKASATQSKFHIPHEGNAVGDSKQ